MNLLCFFILEGVSDEEERRAMFAALDWPDVAEEIELVESDRMVRQSLAAAGIDLPELS